MVQVWQFVPVRMGVWVRVGVRVLVNFNAAGVRQRPLIDWALRGRLLRECPLLVTLLTAGLATAQQDALHQFVNTRSVFVAWTLQSNHFPLCLCWHAGVTVHQRLSGLRKGVGYAVTEALPQACPVFYRARLAACVPDYLCDVLGLAPGALVREQRQTVDVRRRGRRTQR